MYIRSSARRYEETHIITSIHYTILTSACNSSIGCLPFLLFLLLPPLLAVYQLVSLGGLAAIYGSFDLSKRLVDTVLKVLKGGNRAHAAEKARRYAVV